MTERHYAVVINGHMVKLLIYSFLRKSIEKNQNFKRDVYTDLPETLNTCFDNLCSIETNTLSFMKIYSIILVLYCFLHV